MFAALFYNNEFHNPKGSDILLNGLDQKLVFLKIPIQSTNKCLTLITLSDKKIPLSQDELYNRLKRAFEHHRMKFPTLIDSSLLQEFKKYCQDEGYLSMLEVGILGYGGIYQYFGEEEQKKTTLLWNIPSGYMLIPDNTDARHLASLFKILYEFKHGPKMTMGDMERLYKLAFKTYKETDGVPVLHSVELEQFSNVYFTCE